MAVVNVYPNLTSARQGGSHDDKGERDRIVTWFVETDDPADGPEIVLAAPGLPQLYSFYQLGNDLNESLLCKNREADRVPGERLLWEVVITYDSRVESADYGDINPILRPPEKRWSTEVFQRIATHDRFGRAITNTANDAFDPPVQMDDSRLTMTYSRNETEQQMIFAFGFRDCVNEDMFQGFQPGEAKLTHIESERQTPEHNIIYWRTTYEFHFRNRIDDPQARIYVPANGGGLPQEIDFVPPWNITLMNIGYHEINAADQYKRILDTTGRPVAQPVRLEIDGSKMFANNPREDTVYMSFEVYNVKPFGPLNIL